MEDEVKWEIVEIEDPMEDNKETENLEFAWCGIACSGGGNS